jgi:hypothetical protein
MPTEQAMAGTDANHSTPPRPNSPISPTGALKLLLDSTNLSIHAAAALLTTAMRTNECRLWCNDNLVPPHYIATSLVVVARTEADGRPRADVVSRVREAWVQQDYNFEFDADEVRALLASLNRDGLAPPPQTTPKPTAQPEAIDPASQAQSETPQIVAKDTKALVKLIIDEMKQKNEITAEIRGKKRALAKEVVRRMSDLAKDGKIRVRVVVGYEYVEHRLKEWKCWPLDG